MIFFKKKSMGCIIIYLKTLYITSKKPQIFIYYEIFILLNVKIIFSSSFFFFFSQNNLLFSQYITIKVIWKSKKKRKLTNSLENSQTRDSKKLSILIPWFALFPIWNTLFDLLEWRIKSKDQSIPFLLEKQSWQWVQPSTKNPL